MTDSENQQPVSNTAKLTREKTSQWWIQDVSAIGEPARELLETYSKIPPEKVIPHVLEIVSLSYPCLLSSDLPSPRPSLHTPLSDPKLTLPFPTARKRVASSSLPMYRPTQLPRPLNLPVSFLSIHPLHSERHTQHNPPRSRLLFRPRPAQTRRRWRSLQTTNRRGLTE
jgi:hypothetical protein